MAKAEFHFDFGSPNAYLAHLVIPQIEQRTGAKFEYVPVLLGGHFQADQQPVAGPSLRAHPEQARVRAARDAAPSSRAIASLPSGTIPSSRSTL